MIRPATFWQLRAAATAMVLILPQLLGGCEGALYSVARDTDTVEAYRRYLARNPDGQHVAEARKRLEVVQYRRARAVDTPFAYQQFLRQHPDGRLASACKRQQARLALGRARTPAELLLVIERYPRSEPADEARKRLPDVVADEIIKSNDINKLKDFLLKYPTAKAASRVRLALASASYPAVGADRQALERFAREFAGTVQAAAAVGRARALLDREIRSTGDSSLLREYAARYPGHPDLPSLRSAVKRQRTTLRLANLDPKVVCGDPEMADHPVARWCGRRAAACQQLATLARQAAPWRPQLSLSALEKRVRHPNLTLNWSALATLAWMPQAGAGRLLLEQVGSARFSLVWAGAHGFRGWWRRFAAKPWMTPFVVRAASAARSDNDDAVQRFGYFVLVTQKNINKNISLRSLWHGSAPRISTGSAGVSRRLAASYLAAVARPAVRPPPEVVRAFVRHARERLDWLKQAFPEDLGAENLATAQLAEQELFALSRAVKEVALTGSSAEPWPDLGPVNTGTTQLLADWRTRLAKADVAAPWSRVVDRTAAVARHDKARPASLVRLLNHRTAAGRQVGRAICTLDPLPLCSGKKDK